MSPAKLKRDLDPAYVGSTWTQAFHFFDTYQDQPLDLTGKTVTVALDKVGIPDAHHEVTATVVDGVATFRFGRVTWSPGRYAVEVRIEDGADLNTVVTGFLPVVKGAGALGDGVGGAAQPPSAPGVIVSATGAVQVVTVAYGPGSGTAPDPSASAVTFNDALTMLGVDNVQDAIVALFELIGATPPTDPDPIAFWTPNPGLIGAI